MPLFSASTTQHLVVSVVSFFLKGDNGEAQSGGKVPVYFYRF